MINNTFEMTSAKADYIYIPCEITNELSLEALKATREHGQDEKDIKSVAAYLVPHVSLTRPTIGYVVEVITNDGQRIVKRVYSPAATAETAAAILNSFFAAGAPGLDKEYRECYGQQHSKYCERCQRCAA